MAKKATTARPSAGPYGQAPAAKPKRDMSKNLGDYCHPKGGKPKARYQ